MAKYRVLQGIDYGDKRAEAGDVVDDIPQKSVSWLKDQGIIEALDDAAPAKPKPKKAAPAPAPKPEPAPEADDDSEDDS